MGRLFGIELVADWSLIIIFALVAINLGIGVFPSWHPDWSAGLIWFEAITAAVLFFVSVLLHELSHALVGRAYGIPVPRITLFLFGGVSHMEREPPSPKSEFLMAVVGPLASIAIGVLALLVGGALLGRTATETDDPVQIMQASGPVATLALWLGPINLALGIFNMIPGFPLDGGRVLRAFLWRITGSLQKATLWASRGGQLFAWILMGVGVTLALTTGLGQGLWLILIGWFLNRAARASYQQLVVQEALSDVPVTQLMRRDLESVSPETSVEDLVHEHLLGGSQQAFPVVWEGRLIGLVCLADVRRVPPPDRPRTRVRDIMTRAEDLETLPPEGLATDALKMLGRRDVDQVPVVEDGTLQGLVRRQDIVRWLTLHSA